MKIKILYFIILSILPGVLFAANPQVTLQISGAVTGNIVLEIYADTAPITAANFISYVKKSYYNGLIFHRVIKDFMIQGGGFDTNLVQKAHDPNIINESYNGLSNLRGTIAMARTYEPDSANSQFFINTVNNTSLNYGAIAYDGSSNAYRKVGYCVFGRVVSGMSVVDAISAVTTATESGMPNVPVNDVIIQNAYISLNAPVCKDKLTGDINGDCNVDFEDFAEMAENWLLCNSITICD
jgi:cyclophilin family peptidyl-prolyl cis-trans isomerase